MIKYDILSKILNILIQFRLRTRKNNILNVDFIKQKIILKQSFIDLFIEEDEFNSNNENIYLNKFISIINFLQSYSKEINMILELCSFLMESNDINQNFSDKINKEKDENLYEKIKYKIENQMIQIEESKRNPDYIKINKVPFFYLIEPLSIILKDKLKEILDNIKNYNKLKDIFFNNIHYHVQNLIKLERNLFLFSKEIFDLDIMNEIMYKINPKRKENTINNNNNLEIKIELIKPLFIKNEIISNDNERIKTWIDTINSQSICLLKIFEENMDEYSYLMNKILLNYYKCNPMEKERKELIEKVLLNSTIGNYAKLIKYSYPLIQTIFNINKELEPKYITDTQLLIYFNRKDEIKEFIDNKDEQELNEILLYRFEIICDNYFNKILNDKENGINVNKRLCGGNISKNYLNETVSYFYNQNKDKELKNICNIYCIAFIKRYLNYYVDILLNKERYQYLSEREEINELLFSQNSCEIKEIEAIKYYVLKLILNKLNKSWEKFIKYFNENESGIKNYNCFQINLESDESLLSLPILLLDNQNKENLNYNELISKNNLDTEDIKIFSNFFLKGNINEYLYDFLANILILSYNIKQNQYQERKNNYNQLLSSIIKYLNEEYIYL